MKTFATFLGILIVLVTSSVASVKTLAVGGLVPLTGRTSASQGEPAVVVLPALRMALEEINQRADILAGYELKLYFNDTKVFVLRFVLFANKYAKRWLTLRRDGHVVVEPTSQL